MTSAPTVAVRPTRPASPMPMHDVFYLNQNSQVIQRTVTEASPAPRTTSARALPRLHRRRRLASRRQRLDLFGRGTESALWQKTFDPAHGWDAWQADHRGRRLTPARRPHRLEAGRIDVLYGTASLSPLDLTWLPIVGGQPQKALVLDTARVFFGGPTAFIRADGRLEVIWSTNERREGDERCQEPDLAEHQPERLVGSRLLGVPQRDESMTSTPVVARSNDGATSIAYRTGDATLAVSSQVGETWSPWQDIPAPSPAGSSPAIVTVPGLGNLVYLRGDDNPLIAPRHRVGTPSGPPSHRWRARRTRRPVEVEVS